MKETAVETKVGTELPEVAEAEVVAIAPATVETQAVTAKTESFIETLMSDKGRATATDTINAVGKTEMIELQKMSQALKVPIGNIADMDDSKIMTGIINMKVQMDTIHPKNFDLNPGWFGRLIQRITGNSAINKYVTKFQSTDNVIQSIARSLEEGKIMLLEDNAIFKQDRQRYEEAATSLKAKLDMLIDADSKIDKELTVMEEGDKKRFVQEEISFKMKQQIQDLQQTLIVTQQGVIGINILIKNNDELVRSVDRVKNVTMTALSIGATIALGLANQKKVLDATTSINDATNDIILQNSQALKDQGAAIQKQASGTMLDVEKLRQAIDNTVTAIEDVQAFKVNALSEMSKAIKDLNVLTTKVDAEVKKIGKSEEIQLIEA